MQLIKNVIILAAGMGSRLGMDKPKCLVEIHGKKIIDYQLSLLKDFSDIRVVVGFKEEEVIEYINSVRKDITFVRNSDYAHTSNLTSAYLVTKYLNEPFILIDGDIILNKKDFCQFIEKCQKLQEDVVGVTKSKTEEAIFVKIENDYITEFSSNHKYNHEWCGIAYLHKLKINSNCQGYIYKIFETKLPIKSFELEVYEIDTPNDYVLTTKLIQDSNF